MDVWSFIFFGLPQNVEEVGNTNMYNKIFSNFCVYMTLRGLAHMECSIYVMSYKYRKIRTWQKQNNNPELTIKLYIFQNEGKH